MKVLKKGQISIFLIIGAIIIIVGIFLISTDNDERIVNLQDSKNEINLNNNIKENLDKCFESSYYQSLQNIGFFGGIYMSNQTTPNQKEKINYSTYQYTPYLVNNISIYPDISMIKNQFENATKYNFFECVENLNNSYLNYDKTESEFNIDFKDNYINLNIKTPISYNKDNQSITFDSFSYKDDYSYFMSYYNIAKNLTNEQASHPDKICITCIYRIEQKDNIDIYSNELSFSNYTAILYHLTNENLEYNDIKEFTFIHLIDKEILKDEE